MKFLHGLIATSLVVLTTSAVAGMGGPDTYGYTWIDSDEAGGPVYSWVEITSVGTPVPFASYVDDGTVGPIPIGFSFPFYENSFNELYVSSNGWLSFTNGSLQTYTNQPLPNSGASVPENMLAPWWDDMVYDESNANEAFYYNDGSRFIVEMYVRRIAAFTPPFYRFEVILYPNGDIVFQYHTLGTTLNSSTIGIQNATKDDGLTAVFNDSYAHQELAILFSADSDGDGVLNFDDVCPDTVLPDVPTIGLRGARFAAMSDGTFDSGLDQFAGMYTIDDTAGCSGTQIIELLGLGAGHTKFGISKSALETFIASLVD